MESHASLTSLIVVLLAAFITPIILKRFRLSVIPVVVAEIIAGLIIGKSGFDLVQPDPWITILSSLGFIFLMFLSGVEIDFSVFASSGKRKKLPSGKLEPNRFGISSLIFLLILSLSFLISVLFVWMNFTANAFFMSLVISTISLGVVMPTLKENDIMKTGIGQIILLITVIADLVTMILLAVFVSFYEGSGNMWLLLILFAAGLLLYFVGRFFKRHNSFFETMSTGTVQIGMRAIFTLIILLVGLSESVGAENILGAFLAGVLVSLLSPNKEMVKQLDSFGYGFLIPIFFVMVGAELDIWSLFKDPMVLILIPLLFIGLLLSKLIPISLLKRWYDWPTVLGSGFILTSTLSLVVAAAKVGERIGVIDTQMSSALILLAVVTCIITPILFKKVFPLNQVKESKLNVKILGANQLTLPMSVELDPHQYDVSLYHVKKEQLAAQQNNSDFTVEQVANYEVDTLREAKLFEADILVLATGDDKINAEIAMAATQEEADRIIARVEPAELRTALEEQEIETFSSLLSSRTLLKAMVETPEVARIFTSQEEHRLHQVNMLNPTFQGVELRNFPHLGNTIIVRIFRGNESIVPHGDTKLQLNDHLVLTGKPENIEDLRNLLS